MPTTTERLGDCADVVVAVAAERTPALAVFIDVPEQAESAGLIGEFVADIGLKMGRAVGGETICTASIAVFFVVPPNPRSLVTSCRVNYRWNN